MLQGRHPHLCNSLNKVSPGLFASQVQNVGLDSHNVTAIKEKINSNVGMGDYSRSKGTKMA